MQDDERRACGQILNDLDGSPTELEPLNHVRRKFLASVAEKIPPTEPKLHGNVVAFTLEGLRRFQATAFTLASATSSSNANQHDGTRRRPNYNNRKRRFLAKVVERTKHLVPMSEMCYLVVVRQ